MTESDPIPVMLNSKFSQRKPIWQFAVSCFVGASPEMNVLSVGARSE
jgi:hypothetical protein